MWIYDLADYRQMFDLSGADLKKQILDFPAGMSSFNAQMTSQGGHVISGDESYALNELAISQKTKSLLTKYEADLAQQQSRLVNPNDVEHIQSQWQYRCQQFLQDYPQGQKAQRYLPMQLPHLPFSDLCFQLALCSDFLFHSQAHNANPKELIMELCRVAHEVRVYPIMTEKGTMPDALGPVMLHLQQHNFGVEVREVPFHQLKGSNAMLRVWATECIVES